MLPSLSAEHAFCPGFRHSTAVRTTVDRADRISKLLTRIADMESPMMWSVEMASASSTVMRYTWAPRLQGGEHVRHEVRE
ncbi:hypothetical protein ACKKBG_A21620 [Auxenochlorella protothecoides x Auxenochlorella symbiontica]